MRFSRGEVVFYRLKMKSKNVNVAEVNEEKLRVVSRHFGSSPRKVSDLGIFLVPSPEGGLQGWIWSCHLSILNFKEDGQPRTKNT
ncbi:hypothetical protein E2C01_057019 [Portunus trituberculatus]|uniref:Uncharacterized protein n=1 Tax=Portunus trituberculatus TaxID=210409 RepID=A0A5B7H168_PORTR|nr:hypothetical protein [Portunus trituberculatus]